MRKASIGIVVGALMVTGCAGVGNVSMKKETAEQVDGKLVKGVTTQHQVKSYYGVPIETSFTDSGNTIYRYVYDDSSAFTPETVLSAIFTWGLAGSKVEGTRNELTILFDENNIVKTYNIAQSEVEGGTGLFK